MAGVYKAWVSRRGLQADTRMEWMVAAQVTHHISVSYGQQICHQESLHKSDKIRGLSGFVGLAITKCSFWQLEFK